MYRVRVDPPESHYCTRKFLRRSIIKLNIYGVMTMITLAGTIALVFFHPPGILGIMLAAPAALLIIHANMDRITAMMDRTRDLRDLEIVDYTPDRTLPQLVIILMVPTAILCMTLSWAINMYDNSVYWACAVIASGGFAPICIRFIRDRSEEQQASLMSATIAIVFLLLYTYNILMITNDLFDNSRPVLYEALVLDRDAVGKKNTSYYITLGNFGPDKQTVTISVSDKVYESITLHQKAQIAIKAGFLNMSTYEVIP